MVIGCKCSCRVSEPDLSGVAAGGADASAEVQLKICRAGRVQRVSVRLAQDCGLGTQRLVHWCGAQFQVRGPCISPLHSFIQDLARRDQLQQSRKHLEVSHLRQLLPLTAAASAGSQTEHSAELRLDMAQAPHRAVKEGGALPEGCGVFVSRWHHGSPAHRYALYALQFVQEVNGVPTPDLEAFVKAISSLVRVMCPMFTALCSLRTAADFQAQKLPPSWTFLADNLRPSMPNWQPDHQ